MRRQLELLGEDPERDGLLKTPSRVAKSLAWLTRGYEEDARAVIGDALFAESHENMVMVRDIELYSLCEHHLSVLRQGAHRLHPRRPHRGALEAAARGGGLRPAAAGAGAADRAGGRRAAGGARPAGVGVVIEAAHLCMMMRGVEKQNSSTITSALRGTFRDDAKTRDEFLRLAHRAA